MLKPSFSTYYDKWQMIGVPSDSTLNISIFYDDSLFCGFYRWNEPSQEYLITNQFSGGESLWCKAPQGYHLDIDKGTAVYGDYTINLSCSNSPGVDNDWCFNMVSHPFSVSVDRV